MASPRPTARGLALTAGAGLTALLAAAATALPAAADSPHGGDHGSSASAPGHNKAQSSGATAPTDTTGHNPPGNNGTVFIHDVAGDEHPHNVPHVSCDFWVDFFGFDNAQSVTVSFAGQAPTGKDTPLGGTTTTTLQADDAGGAGNDWDGELAFTADQLGVSSLGAPAHQGYHVKMTVVTNQPGDHKYKVFWIQPCAAAPITTQSTSTQPTTVGGESTDTSTNTTTSTTTNTATSTSTGATQSSDVASPQNGATTAGQSTGGAIVPLQATRSNNSIPTEVLGTKFTRNGATPAAAATASSLPFTGAEVGGMAIAAAVALGGGVILTVAGRRRRRVTPG